MNGASAQEDYVESVFYCRHQLPRTTVAAMDVFLRPIQFLFIVGRKRFLLVTYEPVLSASVCHFDVRQVFGDYLTIIFFHFDIIKHSAKLCFI